jgi:hypothetical protein
MVLAMKGTRIGQEATMPLELFLSGAVFRYGPDSGDLRRSFHKMTVPSGGRALFLPAGFPISLNGIFLHELEHVGNG